jgi:hypothetical protein
MQESIKRAFAYMMGQKVRIGVGQQVDTTDFHVEAIDLLSNHDFFDQSHGFPSNRFHRPGTVVLNVSLRSFVGLKTIFVNGNSDNPRCPPK